MSMMASQITSFSIVSSTVCSGKIKENIKASCHWPLWVEPLVTSGFPSQKASNMENVSIWWHQFHVNSIQHISQQSHATCKIIDMHSIKALIQQLGQRYMLKILYTWLPLPQIIPPLALLILPALYAHAHNQINRHWKTYTLAYNDMNAMHPR